MKNIAEEIRKVMPHSEEHNQSPLLTTGIMRMLVLGNQSEAFVGYNATGLAKTASFYIIL